MILDGLTGWHLLIIAAVLLVLFGARRLPDAARSLGRSARILRSEVREFSRDESPLAAGADRPGAESGEKARTNPPQ